METPARPPTTVAFWMSDLSLDRTCLPRECSQSDLDSQSSRSLNMEEMQVNFDRRLCSTYGIWQH
jgi:hypothetical protein